MKNSVWVVRGLGETKTETVDSEVGQSMNGESSVVFIGDEADAVVIVRRRLGEKDAAMLVANPVKSESLRISLALCAVGFVLVAPRC